MGSQHRHTVHLLVIIPLGEKHPILNDGTAMISKLAEMLKPALIENIHPHTQKYYEPKYYHIIKQNAVKS